MNDTMNGRTLSLREFWLELRRGKAGGPCPSSAPSGSAVAGSARPFWPSGASFGSGGSGSGLLGYGLGLVAPDAESRERILRIMKDLCERDAKRRG